MAAKTTADPRQIKNQQDPKKPKAKQGFNPDLLPSLHKGLHKRDPSDTLRHLLHEQLDHHEGEEAEGTTAYMSNFLHLDTKLLDNEMLLERMKQRECDKNVSRYKEELAHLKYLRNPYNVTMSHSNIDLKIQKMLQKEHQREEEQRRTLQGSFASTKLKWKASNASSVQDREEYKKLREYVRLYKQRLYLVPRHQIFNE